MTFDELVSCIQNALAPQSFAEADRDGLTGYDRAARLVQAEARAGNANALVQAVIEVSRGGPHDDHAWWLRLLAFLSFQPGLSAAGLNSLVAEFETKCAWSPTIHAYIFRQLVILGCCFDWDVVKARTDYALIVQCAALVVADAMVRSGATDHASNLLAEALHIHVVSPEAVREQQDRWREFGHGEVLPTAAPTPTAPTAPFLTPSFFVSAYAPVLQSHAMALS